MSPGRTVLLASSPARPRPATPPCAPTRPARGMSGFWTRQVKFPDTPWMTGVLGALKQCFLRATTATTELLRRCGQTAGHASTVPFFFLVYKLFSPAKASRTARFVSLGVEGTGHFKEPVEFKTWVSSGGSLIRCATARLIFSPPKLQKNLPEMPCMEKVYKLKMASSQGRRAAAVPIVNRSFCSLIRFTWDFVCSCLRRRVQDGCPRCPGEKGGRLSPGCSNPPPRHPALLRPARPCPAAPAPPLCAAPPRIARGISGFWNRQVGKRLGKRECITPVRGRTWLCHMAGCCQRRRGWGFASRVLGARLMPRLS